jgi:hypothetical protein
MVGPCISAHSVRHGECSVFRRHRHLLVTHGSGGRVMSRIRPPQSCPPSATSPPYRFGSAQLARSMPAHQHPRRTTRFSRLRISLRNRFDRREPARDASDNRLTVCRRFLLMNDHFGGTRCFSSSNQFSTTRKEAKWEVKRVAFALLQYGAQPARALPTVAHGLANKRERRLAERVGFEPTVEFPLHTLSKRAQSTTLTSLRLESTTYDMASGAKSPIVISPRMSRDHLRAFPV